MPRLLQHQQGLYESRIHAGGPGRIASARTPAALAQGQEAQASRLAREAASAGNDLIRIIGREYTARLGAEVDATLLNVDRQFEEWKNQYRQEHQGQGGINALDDYTAKYGEIAGAALKSFGHEDTVFQDQLRRRLAEHGLYAMRDGGAWQARQDEKWLDSQWNSQAAMFQRFVQDNPLDTAAIEYERGRLLDSMEARFPGQDNRARVMALDDGAARARIEALIARGDEAGLEAAMAAPAGGGFGVFGARGFPEKVAAKIRAESARQGLNEQETNLMLAIAMNESDGRQSCRTKTKSGEEAVGVFQLMPSTARHMGVNREDEDENIRGGIKYMAWLRDRYKGDWKRALMANNWGPGNLEAWERTGKGKYGQEMPQETQRYIDHTLRHLRGGGADSGLSARNRLLAERGLAHIRSQRRLGLDIAAINEFIAANEGKSAAVILDNLYQRLAEIPDAGARGRFYTGVTRELKFRANAAKAARARRCEDYAREKLAGVSPTAALGMVLADETLAPEEKSLLEAQIMGPAARASQANISALAAGRRRIDQGELASPEERQAYAIDHHLTTQQTQNLLAYNGLEEEIPDSLIEAAGRGIFPRDFEMPDYFRALVLDEARAISPGKKPSRQQMAEIIARLMATGTVPGMFFGSNQARAHEALHAGRIASFSPDIPANELPGLNARLEQLGLAPTEHNRKQLYKQRLFNLKPEEVDFRR